LLVATQFSNIFVLTDNPTVQTDFGGQLEEAAGGAEGPGDQAAGPQLETGKNCFSHFLSSF
jgi:hypothetical protein